MPEFRLVYSNGKRSVRHVDVEASDLASAAASFDPPPGWALISVRRTYGLASSVPDLPFWMNTLFIVGPVVVGVVAIIRDSAIGPVATLPALMYVAMPLMMGLIALPLFLRNARAARADRATQPAGPAAHEWSAASRLSGMGLAHVLFEVMLLIWALVVVFGQVGATQALIAGWILGAMAISAGWRLSEGLPGSAPDAAAPQLA